MFIPANRLCSSGSALCKYWWCMRLQDFKTGVKESSFSIAAIFSFATSVSDRFLLFPFRLLTGLKRVLFALPSQCFKVACFYNKKWFHVYHYSIKTPETIAFNPLPAGQYSDWVVHGSVIFRHAIPFQLIYNWCKYFMHTLPIRLRGAYVTTEKAHLSCILRL